MSLLSFPRGRPQCLSCVRRALGGHNDAGLLYSRLQSRGKKKLAKSTTIKVRLLADVPHFGRKGRIIPISPGRMRNDFFPKEKAEYMTVAQLRAIGAQGSPMERDSLFGTRQKQVVSQKSESTDSLIEVPTHVPKAVEVDLIKPEHAMEIVSKVVPENIDFYRSPIATILPRHSPSVPATSAISAAAQEGARPQEPQKISIYGSVSTADIAENLKAVLAEDAKGSRVVLLPEDIVVVSQEEEMDRIKHLGTFEIDIKVKGAKAAIRKTITVKAQE